MGQTGPQIDCEACVGCGTCVGLCPSRVLHLVDSIAQVQGSGCIGCGHCEAVCPAGAVSLEVGDSWAESFASITPTGAVVQPGAFAAGTLVDLLRSRRSCRRFTDAPVSGPMLEDLIRAAVTAPSGTNSQAWTFTALTSRAAVMSLGGAVADFFRHLNKLAANRFVRKAYALIGHGELEQYYREYYPTVAASLVEWDKDRTDRLFHGATAAILIGSRPGASCPAEDALLAAANMSAIRSSFTRQCCDAFSIRWPERLKMRSRAGKTLSPP